MHLSGRSHRYFALVVTVTTLALSGLVTSGVAQAKPATAVKCVISPDNRLETCMHVYGSGLKVTEMYSQSCANDGAVVDAYDELSGPGITKYTPSGPRFGTLIAGGGCFVSSGPTGTVKRGSYCATSWEENSAGKPVNAGKICVNVT